MNPPPSPKKPARCEDDDFDFGGMWSWRWRAMPKRTMKGKWVVLLILAILFGIPALLVALFLGGFLR